MPFHMHKAFLILFISTCFPAVPSNAAFHILPLSSSPSKVGSGNGRSISHHVAINMERKKTSSRLSHRAQVDDSDGEVTKLRDEIERMKKEAREKLDNLEKASSTAIKPEISQSKLSTGVRDTMDVDATDSMEMTTSEKDLFSEREDEVKFVEEKLADRYAISNMPSTSTVKRRDELSLLDDTNWKISLNIGRERGTY